jgi:hypothetical protein
MVLDLHTVPTTENSGFIIALNLGPGRLRQSAGISIDTSPAHIVHLPYVQNRQAVQYQLEVMSQLLNVTANQNTLYLRAAALRLITNSTEKEDIRRGPSPRRDKIALISSSVYNYIAAARKLVTLPMLYELTENGRTLLMNTPQRVEGRSQAIRCPSSLAECEPYTRSC